MQGECIEHHRLTLIFHSFVLFTFYGLVMLRIPVTIKPQGVRGFVAVKGMRTPFLFGAGQMTYTCVHDIKPALSDHRRQTLTAGIVMFGITFGRNDDIWIGVQHGIKVCFLYINSPAKLLLFSGLHKGAGYFFAKLAIGFSDWNTYCGLAYTLMDTRYNRGKKYVW